ncbi:CPBP family intramembrane glutamic endopeptidase [Streptomyces kanamyceticus]|uniref:CPBP family intramembrane metalloprotease n=1 Tax=Streptomyces kanamyceticus TaxID=1967 RepID=A0A5J6GF51_STRKN|nr:CPBP family intramembrane glutamic endopeptidase [Streptomyces kanamyceticus]QEU93102.1 CPBP family intramembrane metalloprotease [Streptomyces kanamyceticus]
MTSLIHTPELREPALAALTLCALSCLALASHLHVRFFDHRGMHTLQVYAAVLAVVAGCGLLVVGPRVLGSGVGWGLLVSPLLGAAVAPLVAAADTLITRRLGRRAARSATRGGRAPATAPRARATRPVGQAARLAGASSATTTKQQWTPSHRDTDVALPLGWLVAVGVLEECVFRGTLTGVALTQQGITARVLILLAATGAFALSHIFFGWAQVAAKLPLSVTALAITLVTGSVLGAVVTHALFNVRIWRYQNTVRGAVAS